MAGTINVANISVGFDASKLQTGGSLTRAAINAIRDNVNESVPGLVKYQQHMEHLAEVTKSGAMTQERAAAVAEVIAKKYGVVTDAAKKLAEAERLKQEAIRRDTEELQRHIQLTRSVETPMERHRRLVNEYTADLKKGIITQETYNRLIQKSGESFGVASSRMPSGRPEQQDSGGGMTIIGGLGMRAMAGAAVLTAAASAAKQSLSLAADVETATVSFEVLTGSASKAMKMIQDMKRMDAESPLAFVGISQAGKTLLGFGMTAEQVMPSLRALGAISMGNQERFNSLALAFGQVQAAGRLTGQEVLQMVNNGFNPLQEISRKTGTSMVELKKQMEDGAISAKMVSEAIISATTSGRFAGMNERLTQTMAGQWAKLASDVQNLGVRFGEFLAPMASEMLTWGRNTIWAASQLSKLGGSFVLMRDGFTAVSATLRGDLFGHLDRVAEKQRDITQATLEAAEATREQAAAAVAASNALTRTQQQERDMLAARAGNRRSEFDNAVKSAFEEYQQSTLSPLQLKINKLETTLSTMDMMEGDRQAIKDSINYLRMAENNRKNEENRRDIQARFDQLSRSKPQSFKVDANALGVDKTIAPMLKAGTVEAFKYFTDQTSKVASKTEQDTAKLREIAEKEAKWTEEMAKVLQEANANSVKLLVKGR